LSKKSAPPLFFTLNKSRRLIHILRVLHILAALASVLNALPILFKLITFLAVVVSFKQYSSRYDKHFQRFFIRYSEETGWQLSQNNSVFQRIEILPTSVVSQYVIVLHFHLQDKKQLSRVIFYDALSTQDYRALVVALKVAWHRKENEPLSPE